MSAFRSLFSGYSSDEVEWNSSRKSSKKKFSATGSKKARMDRDVSDPEEGEIPSDALEDDEDDGWDEDYYGDEADRERLHKMSEKEREEELYRRSERREAMRVRRNLKLKLREQKEKEKNDKGHQLKQLEKRSSEIELKKTSTYSGIYSSDSDEDDGASLSDESVKSGLRDRKNAVEDQKKANSQKFKKLIECRKQKQQKQESAFSDSGDESKNSYDRSRSGEKSRSNVRKIYSSGSSDSESNHSGFNESVARKRRSLSSSSRSSSRSSSASSDDDRGRSRSPIEELVTSVDQISRIRLSRYRFERWVHMPFFDELVKGCFARINIGLSKGVPIYRCGEIVDVVETPKTYDIGKTRTNKGIVLRIGKDQHTFRLAFVSNSEFQPSEFESWVRRTTEDGLRPPTTAFVAKKYAEIQKAANTIISDERVFEQIIQSKRRFQKAPTNFALRKAELMKQREIADEEGKTETVRRLDIELDELETQAERIDRRRTIGFKSITTINQRNRELSVKQAEEAIMKESMEAAQSREEDPFMRIQSKPVIVTKSYLEKLRNKRNANNAAEDACKKAEEASEEKDDPEKIRSNLGSHGSALSLNMPTEQSLHDIHDFEIDIKMDLESSTNKDTGTSSAIGDVVRIRSVDDMRRTASAAAVLNGSSEPYRRPLNLQEYKRRRGLI